MFFEERSAVERSAVPPALLPDEVHEPAGRDHSRQKQHKAIGSIPNHRFRRTTLCNAEDDRRKRSEQNNRGEMRRSKGHGFLPTAMLCASTAEIRFNNPATTTNFAP